MRILSMSPTELSYPSTLRLWTMRMLAGYPLSDATSDPRWKITDYSEVIGKGDAALRAASYRLLTWQVHRHAHVGVNTRTRARGNPDGDSSHLHNTRKSTVGDTIGCTGEDTIIAAEKESLDTAGRETLGTTATYTMQPRVGDVIVLRFGLTSNPCRILHLEKSTTRTVLVYGTLSGHIERGEEAFIIERQEDGSVTGRCLAFSQHAWWLAKAGAPIARWVQKRETRLYVDGMRPRTAPHQTYRGGHKL
ncbi:DUF1990 family protein [Corynebacterium anserum]|uniref:DUF1990 family protein n=2 Tax=Corynebacterium anserum TaxID=2684406 RepID=A0A7G7YND9_9CORY|nr:DUF1990 family protein [Corynebacterium anserum]